MKASFAEGVHEGFFRQFLLRPFFIPHRLWDDLIILGDQVFIFAANRADVGVEFIASVSFVR